MSQPLSPGAQSLQSTIRLLESFEDAPLLIKREGKKIEITPTLEGGFPISLYDQDDCAMIAAERWHAHYEDPMQAAFCVLWLLSPYYRVVHELKGGVLVAVWIERYEAEGWVGFEPVYFLNPEHEKSWELVGEERYAHRYHQQFILPSPRPYEELSPGVQLDEDGLPPDAVHGKHVVYVEKPVGPSLFE